MKSQLSVVVILTVASIGSAAFAQDVQSGVRAREERVKEAMTTPNARKGIASGAAILGAGFAWSGLSIRSESLDRINGKIARYKMALEQKDPVLVQKENALKEIKAIHATEEIEANHKIILEASNNLKKIKPEALAKVGGVPGDLENYLAKQQADLDAAAAAHAMTIQEKQALITQADEDLKGAIKASAPEVQALKWELKAAEYSKSGFMKEAVMSTLGSRVIKLSAAAGLFFIAGHEVAVLEANSSEPRAATPEETNEAIKILEEAH